MMIKRTRANRGKATNVVIFSYDKSVAQARQVKPSMSTYVVLARAMEKSQGEISLDMVTGE